MAGQSSVLRMLGYFSLIGLLRMHVLVGDFQSALKGGGGGRRGSAWGYL